MSELSYMDKLLDGVEIEWKELWQVTTWDKKFNAVEREKQPNVIKYHYFLAKDLKSLALENGDVKLLTTNSSDIWTSEELAGDKISEGEIIAIPWGGNPIIQYYKGKFVTTDNRIATSNDKNILSNKFLYYYLLSKIDLVSSFYRGSGIKHPSMYDVLHISIPLPPLNIQAEIVRILDAFTDLTAELTAELVARKQQYAYYREQLFTFGEGKAVWKKLGDIAKKISSGGTPKTGIAEYWEDGTIPWMSSGEVNLKVVYKTEKYITESGLKNSSAKIVPKNSIVIALAGQGTTRGKVARTRIDLTTNQSLAYLTFDATPQYENLRQISSGSGTRGGLNLKLISNYEIPIPPLAEQKRIVTILDKFDTLTTSLTEGLPREIALRQQQYEYYRELLLSFPKTEVANHD